MNVITAADAFRWRDSAHNNTKRLMTLSIDEFLRRFLLHVLPPGFVRIRHFGFLAHRRRSALLPLCFQLLAEFRSGSGQIGVRRKSPFHSASVVDVSAMRRVDGPDRTAQPHYDADIIEWRWLYIDVDAIRPAGISASNTEHEAALERTLRVREFSVREGLAGADLWRFR